MGAEWPAPEALLNWACRYLNWIGVNTKVFNAGDYRRLQVDARKPKHDFFNPANSQGKAIRWAIGK